MILVIKSGQVAGRGPVWVRRMAGHRTEGYYNIN